MHWVNNCVLCRIQGKLGVEEVSYHIYHAYHGFNRQIQVAVAEIDWDRHYCHIG